MPTLFQEGRSATFVDWSTGGDETVIATAEANRLRIVAAFRERDAVQVVRRVARLLQTHSLLSSRVAADAAGIAGPMCAQLVSDFVAEIDRHFEFTYWQTAIPLKTASKISSKPEIYRVAVSG
jgi:hypothetical protein